MSDARQNYLSAGDTVKSWLLTTDHKRIGILFLLSILFFFSIAAAAAALMRLELLHPQGHLVVPDTYNKLFTIHGVLMVWFFLIPSIPSVLGILAKTGTATGLIWHMRKSASITNIPSGA